MAIRYVTQLLHAAFVVRIAIWRGGSRLDGLSSPQAAFSPAACEVPGGRSGVPDHSLPCSFRFTRRLCLVYVPFTERQTFHRRYLCVHQSGGGNPVGMVVAAGDASRNGMGGNGNRPCLSGRGHCIPPTCRQSGGGTRRTIQEISRMDQSSETRLQSEALLPLQGTIAD